MIMIVLLNMIMTVLLMLKVADESLFCVYFSLAAASFLLQFWADPADKYAAIGGASWNDSCPEDSASFPSRLLFSWFLPILRKGWRRPLTTESLFNMDR